jgi:hypothetical protein
MTQAIDLVLEAKAVGISFRIEGEQVIVRFPKARREELAPIIDALRQHREELESFLRNKSTRDNVTVDVFGRPFQYEAESLAHPNPSLVIVFVNGCEHVVHRSLEGTAFAVREHAVICENRGSKQEIWR